MTESQMMIPQGEKRRATPNELPRLVIPQNHRHRPEEVTISRVTQFLSFCARHGRAPPSRERAVNEARPAVPSKSPSVEFATAEEGSAVVPTSPEDPFFTPTDEEEFDLPTLEFDARDLRELARKQRELEDAKVEHGFWVARLNDDPRDPETLEKCRHWRRVREEINAVIRLIPKRLRVRREFREEFNRKWAAVEG